MEYVSLQLASPLWDHTVLHATRHRWHSRPYPSKAVLDLATAWYFTDKFARSVLFTNCCFDICWLTDGLLYYTYDGTIKTFLPRPLSVLIRRCIRAVSQLSSQRQPVVFQQTLSAHMHRHMVADFSLKLKFELKFKPNVNPDPESSYMLMHRLT